MSYAHFITLLLRYGHITSPDNDGSLQNLHLRQGGVLAHYLGLLANLNTILS